LAETQYKNINRWEWYRIIKKVYIENIYGLSGSKIPPERVNSDAAG